MLNFCKTQDFIYKTLRGRLIPTSHFCSKEENSTTDKTKRDTKKRDDNLQEETAVERLNRLLMSIQTTDNQLIKQMPKVASLPGGFNRKKRNLKKTEAESKDVFSAAAKVASHLNEENRQQIESELLSKLLGRRNNNVIESNNTGQNIKEETSKESDISITELIVGMKIDRSQKPIDTFSRGEYVKRSIAVKKRQQTELKDKRYKKLSTSPQREPEVFTGNVNLFGAPPLNIFNKPHELKVVPDILNTWSALQEKFLKMQVSRPPANYFEKIARWTEQGKVWHFPINNEQDWSAEYNVDFSEHIFLDQHLESWCPQHGPIRHFMELVCVGLSKNPYLTAKEKKEHILWYRDYFESKKEILREAIGKESLSQIKGT